MDVSSAKQQAQQLEQQGKVREALAMYRHVLTSLEGTPELLRELPLYVKAGDLFLKLDNPRAAVSLYETAGKIYAVHGSAKSVNAICAKVVRVMPERTHVYTRFLRIMLEHGHVAAARHVLAAYAEHADLSETRDRLELIADRTDEHVRPVLEMLVEMAERLELPHSAAVAEPEPEEIAASEEPAPAAAIDLPLGFAAPPGQEQEDEEEEQEEEGAAEPPDEDEQQAIDDGSAAEPVRLSLEMGLLRADAVPVVEEAAEADEERADEGEPEAAPEVEATGPVGMTEATSVETEDELDVEEAAAAETETEAVDVVDDDEEEPEEARAEVESDDEEEAEAEPDAQPVEEREPVGGPFGLGLVTTDLASEVESRFAPPVVAPPPFPVFDEARSASASSSGAAPEGEAPGDDSAHAESPPSPPEPPDTPLAAEDVPRKRVRGDGRDWDLDPALPGRAARRRSPVGSVLLEVAERERRGHRRHVWMAVAAGAVAIVAGGIWGVRALRAPANDDAPGMIADSIPLDSAVAPTPPPSGTAAENVPLTLRSNPALAAESLALPPISDSLASEETTPRVGMPPAEGGVTVVALSGLPIQRVSDVIIEGRPGYEVRQALETGERLLVLSIPAEPEDTVAQGEVRIAPGAGGVLTARLRVGAHDVEVRGNVTEAAMRTLVLRLAETSTTPE